MRSNSQSFSHFSFIESLNYLIIDICECYSNLGGN